MVFPIYVSNQKFENSIDLLLLINDDQLRYVYIKDFNTFMFPKTKTKNKKWFCRSCLQCFSQVFFKERVLKKFLQIQGKTPVLESLFS